jgi:hypothetical protein
MADFKSPGSFGLSHFRSSRASQEMFEPIYLNLFTIQIALPPAIGATEEDTNLLLENVIKIDGLLSDSFPASPVAQYYKWAARRFAGAKPAQTTMDLSLDFEVNLNRTPSAYVLKTLRKWNDLVYDPLTGRQSLKQTYVSPWVLITLNDRAGSPFWQWKLYNVQPGSAIPAPPLAYQSEEIYRITGYLLLADSWDESIV